MVEEPEDLEGCLIVMIGILDDQPGTGKVGEKLICEGIGKLPCVALKKRYGRMADSGDFGKVDRIDVH